MYSYIPAPAAGFACFIPSEQKLLKIYGFSANP